MQTIHLEVKDIYVTNLVTMLQSLKDIMIDKIEVESSIDDERILKSLQQSSLAKTWENNEDKVWDEL